jgi:hypothetical protein
LRVSARTANGPSASARIDLANPPPWAPVAPTTAISFFSTCSLTACSFSDLPDGHPARYMTRHILRG